MSDNKQVFPPKLTDVLNEQKKDVMKSINCIKVGIIQSFDASDQTVSIKLSIKRVLETNPDGSKLLQEYPVLLKCPAIILSGGDSHLTFPIANGDDCLVLFNDRDIDNWFYDGAIDPPNTNRVHDISDGFALIGVSNVKSAITDYLTDGVRLRFDANNKIDIKSENLLVKISTASINLITNAINSIATLWTHTGNLTVTGNTVSVDHTSSGVLSGTTVTAGNGVSGTFTTVTVVDGIVTSGT